MSTVTRENVLFNCFITISDISLEIKIRLTKMILTGENNIPPNIFPFHIPTAATRGQLPSKFFKVPPECAAYWCIFLYTSGRFALVWLRYCESCSALPSSEKLYFRKTNPTATQWCFIFQLAAAEYRDTHDLFFFFLPLRFPSTVPIFPFL